MLVRRLINATTELGTVALLNMPAGDDIRLHGWDGRTTAAQPHPYIPVGDAVWEMGVGQEPKDKANEDYDKRSKQPNGVDPATATFVFVTPLVWAGKHEWAAQRKAEGIWRDIRVVDGQVLADWLDLAPGVGVWFHAERGTPVNELDDVETSWRRNVAERYGAKVSPELIIGGRETEAKRIREWVDNPNGDYELAVDSAEEAVVFVLASLRLKTDAARRDNSDVLVARSCGCTHYLGTLQAPHVVLVETTAIASDLRALRLRHVHLIAPVERNAGPEEGPARDRLLPLHREAVEKELLRLGFRERVAERLAQECRGSLQALLWAMERRGGRSLAWTHEPAAGELSPLVLARQWLVSESADHQVLARLADRDYRDVRAVASRWRGPTGPLQVWGDHWDWRAWRVAWEYLSPSFTTELVRRFWDIAIEVLATHDPALELPVSERWMASVRKKVHPYSAALRGGLVGSIVMLALHSDSLHGIDGKSIAAGLVRRLLNQERLTDSWMSLARWLPDLAEAAPEVFLDSTENFAADPEAVRALFAEGGPFSSSPHTYLLWALERLAWSHDHLARVLIILAKLAEMDPGGQLMNRPRNSLRHILLPWHPGTSVGSTERLDAFDQFAARHPATAWTCGLSLLPCGRDTASPTDSPRYRDWKPVGAGRSTRLDYRLFIEGLVDRLIRLAGTMADRWAGLVGALPNLMVALPKQSDKIFDALQRLDDSAWGSDDRFQINHRLGKIVRRHEQYPDAEWSLEEVELVKLRRLAARFQPTRARDLHRWLFSNTVRIGDPKKLSWEEQYRQLQLSRREALSAVLAQERLVDALSWGTEVEWPESLGDTLGDHEMDGNQEWTVIEGTVLCPQTVAGVEALKKVGRAYVRRREATKGAGWRDSLLARVHARANHEDTLELALGFAPAVDFWEHLALVDPALADAYWQIVQLTHVELAAAESALPRLVKAGRPLAAVTVAGFLANAYSKPDADPDAVRKVLGLCVLVMQSAAGQLGAPVREYVDTGWVVHSVEEILNFVDAPTTDDQAARSLLAQWEWQWLAALEHSGRGLRVLTRELSRSPELFIDLLSIIYKSADERTAQELPPIDEARQAKAAQAWKLLHLWRLVPGLELESAENASSAYRAEEDLSATAPAVKGKVNPQALDAWVKTARKLAAESGRSEACDIRIGQIFAFAPADDDGVWPCLPVRACIERLASQDLESGFETSIADRRGVHFRGSNGDDERLLRDGYRQMAARTLKDSPRTAAVLRRVAEQYDAEAKSHDEEGRRREFDR